MKLSIGIFAHNDSDSAKFVALLHSLLQQTLVTQLRKELDIEIIFVSHGCTSNTAEIAKKTFQQLTTQNQQSQQNHWHWKVCEVLEAGKSNAWNLLIHKFTAPDTDFIYLMDADIQLHTLQTLAKILEALEQNSEHWIALDQPIKDLELKSQKSFSEQLLVAVSQSFNQGQLHICGQLYCGRGEVLREIWMPVGLPVEDGFLSQIIISENFTIKNPTCQKRIVRVPEAAHIFNAYTNPLKMINHEVQVVMGTVINICLTYYLQEQCSKQLPAGQLIAQMNQENRLWLNDFMHNYFTQKRWWLIPLSLVLRRFKSLKNHAWHKALLRIPIASLAFLVDLSVFIRANRQLHRATITNV